MPRLLRPLRRAAEVGVLELPASEEGPSAPEPMRAGVTSTCLRRLSDWISDLILMGVPRTLADLGVRWPESAEEGVP